MFVHLITHFMKYMSVQGDEGIPGIPGNPGGPGQPGAKGDYTNNCIFGVVFTCCLFRSRCAA